jgi:hypothetical protein
VPLTRYGLGTRRLTSLSIQDGAVEGGSIVAIDEIEHGLDPHRLAHALRYLKDRASSGKLQVLLTTHSPIVVAALEADDLSIVAARDGGTSVSTVPSGLDAQGMLRSNPAAILGRLVVVGEGATEVGMIRELFARWDQGRVGPSTLTSITAGLAIVNGGGGASAARRAKLLADLGYPVLTLVDNDDASIDTALDDAKAAGVTVLRWTSGRALEDELAAHLDHGGLRDLLAAAAEERGEESIRATVANHLGGQHLLGLDPLTWVTGDLDLEAVRGAIGRAAKGQSQATPTKEDRKAWFKRESGGGQLGALVIQHWPVLRSTTIGKTLDRLRDAVYVPSVTGSAGTVHVHAE